MYILVPSLLKLLVAPGIQATIKYKFFKHCVNTPLGDANQSGSPNNAPSKPIRRN